MHVTLFREFSLQYERHWENSANTLRSIHPLHRPNCPGGQLEMYPESSRSRHYRHRWNFSFRKSPQPVRPFYRPMWRSPIVLAFGLRFWEVPKCYKVWSGSMCYASGVLSQVSAHLKKCRIVNFRTNRAISNIFRSVMARDGRKCCSGPSWWLAEVPGSTHSAKTLNFSRRKALFWDQSCGGELTPVLCGPWCPSLPSHG